MSIVIDLARCLVIKQERSGRRKAADYAYTRLVWPLVSCKPPLLAVYYQEN